MDSSNMPWSAYRFASAMRSSASIGIVSSAAMVRNRGRGTVTFSDIRCRYYRSRLKTLRWLAAVLVIHAAFGSDFRPAEAGYDFEFPRDHGSHNEYRTEWWYYTGHL